MSLFLLFEEQLKNVSVKNYHVIREGVERGQKENPLQSINTSQNEAGIHDCKNAGYFASVFLPLYLSRWLG